MLEADSMLNKRYKIIIYMDSDAVVNKAYANTSAVDFISMMQAKLDWDYRQQPMVFNQDGACWWCNLVDRVGYNVCLNAGSVLWYRHPKSTQVLRQWWDSALDPYEGNPIRR